MSDAIKMPERERGAALLTVLLLVAVMAVITATALDRLRLSTRLAVNGAAMAQARAYSYAAEAIAAVRLEDLIQSSPAQLTVNGDWLGRDLPVPVDRGQAVVNISDGQNCFNLNSLVSGKGGQLSANRRSIGQFAKLMTLLAIAPADAAVIADATADWIDSDSDALPSGAEDGYYAGLSSPFLAANRLLVDAGELRAVRGVTSSHFERLRPWICALPISEPVKLNANTLIPERAILLAALLEGKVSPTQAKALLAIRPAGGYGSAVRFWAQPQLAAAQIPADIQGQIGVTSNWFFIRSRIAAESIELESEALLDARSPQVRTIWRRWGDAG